LFEEAYCGSVDMEEPNMNASAVAIKVNNILFDFNSAEQHIWHYTKFKELGRSILANTEYRKSM
ncbi:23340_t:CDS:1, partial [Gigaspora margarita]